MFGPGFFSSEPVHVALVVGSIVAVVSGLVGTFTVMRGQSFAGHSLADIGATGGAGAYLVGANVLFGFVAMNLIAAAVMGLVGINRPKGRDLATGIVLGASLGLAALFLYWDTTTTSSTGAAVNVLFGSLFTLSSSVVPFVVALAVIATGVVVVLYRPLLLSSLNAEMARARGVPVSLVSIGYLAALAVAVSLSAVTIGAILSTALLVGPPSTALRLTKRVGAAMLLSAGIGVFATFVGVMLAYDSYYWTSAHQAWPVSFFVVAVLLALYLIAPLFASRRGRSPNSAGGDGAAKAGAGGSSGVIGVSGSV